MPALTRSSLLLLALAAGCQSTPAPAPDEPRSEAARLAALRDVAARLRPLHRPPPPVDPGDWLDAHDEPGQTFADYLGAEPVQARGVRRVLYVQPLGVLTDPERAVVNKVAEHLGLYVGLPVRVLAPLPLALIPPEARRSRWPGELQVLTSHIIHELLRPRLPTDAAALLALTAVDLFPEPSWNYVFGMASLRKRCGVWSIHRLGDPAGGTEALRQILLRTLKISTHETGHMLSIPHCIAYACNMAGSNNLDETDESPLALCPECLPKVLWATGDDAAARFERLLAFYAREGLEAEAEHARRSLNRLRPRAPPPGTPPRSPAPDDLSAGPGGR